MNDEICIETRGGPSIDSTSGVVKPTEYEFENLIKEDNTARLCDNQQRHAMSGGQHVVGTQIVEDAITKVGLAREDP